MHDQRVKKYGEPGEAASRLKRGGINTKHPLYSRWRHMILRCYDETSRHYADWGARGITVCDRWRGPDGLENYVLDVGLPPGPGFTLDRIDNDGPYSPENCRWATAHEQTHNRRPAAPTVRVEMLRIVWAEMDMGPLDQLEDLIEGALRRYRQRIATKRVEQV